MKSYLVTWEIEIDASTPTDAARQALEIQRDPSSLSTFFKVTDQKGVTTDIDLVFTT